MAEERERRLSGAACAHLIKPGVMMLSPTTVAEEPEKLEPSAKNRTRKAKCGLMFVVVRGEGKSASCMCVSYCQGSSSCVGGKIE